MADQQINLTDEELAAGADELRKDPSLLNRLDSDTRRRWVRVAAPLVPSHAPAEKPFGADLVTAVAPSLPMLGGLAGGLAGMAAGPGTAVAGAGIGGMIGSRLQQYAKAYTGAETLPPQLDAIKQMGQDFMMQAGMEATGQVAAAAAMKVGLSLMQRGLKPTQALVEEYKNLGIGSKRDVAQAVMDEPRALATAGTVERAQGRIGDINQQISQLTKAGGHTGLVSVADATRPINEVAQRAMTQANPEADIAAVNAVYDEFLRHPLREPGGFSVANAQDIKVGTYQKLKDKFGELGSATVEANKGLARGLREGIATQVPEVATLNRAEARQMLIRDAAAQAVARSGNRDVLGFANVATTSPLRLLTALADRSPVVKTALGRAASQGAAPVLRVTPEIVRMLSIAQDYLDQQQAGEPPK